jgi:hypothetical protein
MPMKLLVPLIAAIVISLVLGFVGYNNPNNFLVLICLLTAVSTWVLCLSFIALCYLPLSLSLPLIAATVIFLVLGVSGYYYPSSSYLLLFLVIAVSTWVLCLSCCALSLLNREVDESDLKQGRR